MAQIKWKSEDFSPVFGPEERPVREGYYPSTQLEYNGSFAEAHQYGIGDYIEKMEGNYYWDGQYWLNGAIGDVMQSPIWWFGLKVKP